MPRFIPIAILVAIASTGCAVNQLQKDQDQIRVALLNLYTNQLIDNLIRAHNGMPIIQLDYTNATGQVTCKQAASFSGMQAVTDSRVLALPAAALNITRTIVTTVSGNAAADHTNQVAVAATPVITSHEVYDAYLEFLSLPNSLMATCTPPPKGAAQICRQCGDMYYWVPIEYQKEFFALSLATTAQRGKSLFTPEDFFSVKITKVLGELPKRQFDAVPILIVKLDKEIPKDRGFVKLIISGKEVQYIIGPYDDDDAAKSHSDTIVLYFDTEAEGGPATLAEFKGKVPIDGKVYLRHNQPKPPTTEELLERANFQLQQIQLNQIRDSSLSL